MVHIWYVFLLIIVPFDGHFTFLQHQLSNESTIGVLKGAKCRRTDTLVFYFTMLWAQVTHVVTFEPLMTKRALGQPKHPARNIQAKFQPRGVACLVWRDELFTQLLK